MSIRSGEEQSSRLDVIIRELLKPQVSKIDAEALYPVDYLTAVGEAGCFGSAGESEATVRLKGVKLVERTAVSCMTTAFNIWCHLASLTYLRHSDNDKLKDELLPKLECGELRGGTGLSNPMKFYAGIDRLYLKAERVQNGYVLTGQLPMVSNLGSDHWFGVVADTGERRIMAFVSCETEGLRMEERLGFLGLNGSATYTCQFDQVLITDDWVVSIDADQFIETIRPIFVLYQIPLSLGVIAGSIRSMKQAKEKQAGCNRYLPVQPEHLEPELVRLREETHRLAQLPNIQDAWKSLLRVRLDTVYLALNAVQSCMLHQGSAGYLMGSAPSRRLREAYFYANLTPTVRHLEKLLAP